MTRMKNHVVEFFMDLYKDPRITKPKLDGVSFKSLTGSQRDWLKRPFEEEEVKKVVWSIEDDNLQVQMDSLWHFTKLVGMFLSRML